MYLFSLIHFPSPTKSKDPDERAIIHLKFTCLFTIHPSFYPLIHPLIRPSIQKIFIKHLPCTKDSSGPRYQSPYCSELQLLICKSRT